MSLCGVNVVGEVFVLGVLGHEVGSGEVDDGRCLRVMDDGIGDVGCGLPSDVGYR